MKEQHMAGAVGGAELLGDATFEVRVIHPDALHVALEQPSADCAAGAPGAQPVIDARRSEVFTLVEGQPVCVSSDELTVAPGQTYVGDGAVRYRSIIEDRSGVVPPDEDPVHIAWARHHAALASDFGPAELAEPIYLRVPDAERALRR